MGDFAPPISQERFRVRHDHVTDTEGYSCESDAAVGETYQKLQVTVVEMEVSCGTAAKTCKLKVKTSEVPFLNAIGSY